MIHQITDNFNMHLLANVVQLYKPVIVMMLFGFTIHAISDNWVNTLVNRFSNLPTWVYVAVFTLLILVLIQFIGQSL
jgi:apolipoprotein N-acyltransferase